MFGLVVRVMKDYDAQYAREIKQPVWDTSPNAANEKLFDGLKSYLEG